jgi:hypothetical protein
MFHEIEVLSQHRLHLTSERYHAFDAYQRVCGNRSAFFSAAKSVGGQEISLSTAMIECPRCYGMFRLPDFEESAEEIYYEEWAEFDYDGFFARLARRDRFFEWALQLSLFEIGATDGDFLLAPFDADKRLECEHCRHSSKVTVDGSTSFLFSIRADNGGIAISHTINQEGDYPPFPGNSRKRKSAPPPAQPSEFLLKFDHSSGKTYFIESGVEASDITEARVPLKGHIMRKMVEECPKIRAPLILAFTEANGGSLPFSPDDITLDTLIMLNRFRGFPAAFYLGG